MLELDQMRRANKINLAVLALSLSLPLSCLLMMGVRASARDTSYSLASYFVLFSPSSPFISSKGSHLTYSHTPHSTIFLSHFPTSLLSLHISPTPRPTSFSLHTLPHRRFLCSFSIVLLFCEQENIHCLTGIGKRRWVVGSCPPEIRWGRWWLGIGSRNSA